MSWNFGVGSRARERMYEALQGIADAVGSTIGPGGRNFAYDKLGPDMRYMATFTKDGLTVLRALGFEDSVWDAVLQYCKQSAAHSVLASGDGTSSTILIAEAVARYIQENPHQLPQAFSRQIEKEADRCVEAIKKEAIKTEDAVRQVALTSTNGDEELTDVVLEAISKSSAHGTIVTEKNPASKTRYQVKTQDGYNHCKGYDYNNTLAWSADERAASNEPIEWESPFVALFNGHIIAEHQLEPVINAWNQTFDQEYRNLVIFAFEISDEVANKLLVINRTLAKFGVSAFVVKPRLSSEVNSGLQVLRDTAAFCGIDESKVIDGGNYKQVDPSFFGTCGKIKISPSDTVFMGRAEDHWVEKRVQQNLNIINEARVQHDREVTAIRNSQLTEGLVKVEVGDGLMPDLQERADRLDDASKAAQSCMTNGALPGAGASYMRAAETAGVSSELKSALAVVHQKIMENIGAEPQEGYGQGETSLVKEDENGVQVVNGHCQDLGVMDACDTVCAVIRNGVSLGVKIATLGGFSLRTQTAKAEE